MPSYRHPTLRVTNVIERASMVPLREVRRTTQKPYARISVIPVSTRSLGKERLYAAESNYDQELQEFQAPRRVLGAARGGTGREQGG